jgi:hypothetical protein
MIKSTITAIALVSMFLCGLGPTNASAQENVLAEIYGRGVHAYYAGRYLEAEQHLTSAINNDINDPRAYYFRGIIYHAQGRSYEAEQDWREGARIEATGTTNVPVGRSLSRFQGMQRLKLEEIRSEARLAGLSRGPTRSEVRMNEIEAAEPPTAAAPRPPVPRSSNPLTPPPTPPAADNPFADDGGLADGQPKVEEDDALSGAMENPFKDDAAAAAPAAAGGADDAADPFGGGAAAGDAADPFGGGDSDPFGGGDAGGAMDDPFGGSDPFGGN